MSLCVVNQLSQEEAGKPKGNENKKSEGFPGGLAVKNLPANIADTGDKGSIPGSGRSSGGRNGNLLQYSCLENPVDRDAWRAIVYGVTKSWAQLKRLSMHAGTQLTRTGCVQFSSVQLLSHVRLFATP